jgi:hypothetical protein
LKRFSRGGFVTGFRFLTLAAALAMSPAARAQLSTPTPMQPTAPAPIAATGKAQTVSYSDQVICKFEGETGSRLGGRRMCHTRAQWDTINHYAAEKTRAAQALAVHMNPSGG